MSIRRGVRRLLIVGSVIYWIAAAWMALSANAAGFDRVYRLLDNIDVHYTPAEQARMASEAQQAGWGDGASVLIVFALGYAAFWIVWFVVRWVIRGFRAQA